MAPAHYVARLNRPENWWLSKHLPDGHRLFESVDTSHGLVWSLADDSGPTPPETDDGVLLLDRGRPLMIFHAADADSHEEICRIPVLAPKGEATMSVSDAATLLQLAQVFTWTIMVDRSGVHASRKHYTVTTTSTEG